MRAAATEVVARPALFALLAAAAPSDVTLVAAPAGSGKTVLVRSWIDSTSAAARTAWVSIDRGERDAQRFWLAVVEKLRALDAAEDVVEQLTPAPDFDGAAVVDRLVSQLGSLEQPILLVIDDLHELLSPAALGQLESLLAHRPPLLHIVLISRHDPQLSLHRLRLAGQLSEIRGPDLRFTLEETRQLLAGSGIVLSDHSVSLLHARTEGWAAGLRLAAISLARHSQPEQLVAEFAGSERTVAEYLLAEVLERQTAEVRRLLLRTSILERVSGSLSDLLVGTSGSERILQELEAANAFVVALDAGRTWFRYHHLFADLLRLELRRSEPEKFLELHRLASDWYARHGDVVDAVRHAQAAEEWSRAAQLLVDSSMNLSLHGQNGTLAALTATFSTDASFGPDVALLYAIREMTEGSLDAATAYLALTERHASEVADDRKRRFDLTVAVTRMSLARRRGDFGSVVEKVQALVGPADAGTLSEVELTNEARAVALMNLGMVELWAYRREEAAQHLQQGLELAQRISLPYVETGCLSHLAVVDAWDAFAQVRLRCLEAIAIADSQGWSTDPIVCVALVMMGLMDVAQARFEAAQGWLDRADATLQPDLEPATALLMQRARGMLYVGRGRLNEALAAFRAAERLQSMLVTPHALTAQMHEWLVVMLVRLGRLEDACLVLSALSGEERQWGETRTALAFLRLAEGDPAAADEALAPVVAGASPVLHPGSLVEALLVHALARDRLGDVRVTERDVERALEIAEPDTQMFPFVLVQPVDVLKHHPRHRTAHAALLSEILDALAGAPLRPVSSAAAPLREDLSESELRVLRYLPSNLSAPEIAAELYLSTSTIKTHMRQIYAKLDAHKRTEAVERARQLGLLGPSAR
jgi:LuxR family transcriptional regulator, maltose regulon positive regulatory protein